MDNLGQNDLQLIKGLFYIEFNLSHTLQTDLHIIHSICFPIADALFRFNETAGTGRTNRNTYRYHFHGLPHIDIVIYIVF